MAFFIPVRHAAESLGISRSHLYRLIKSKQIPFYQLSPRTIRVDPEEVKSLARRIARGKGVNE